jgi:hypothetical protein
LKSHNFLLQWLHVTFLAKKKRKKTWKTLDPLVREALRQTEAEVAVVHWYKDEDRMLLGIRERDSPMGLHHWQCRDNGAQY